MIVVLVGIMFACLLLGFPMFMCMILSSTVVIFAYLDSMQSTTIIQQLMSGVDSFALLAIPLFIFAGGHHERRTYGKKTD